MTEAARTMSDGAERSITTARGPLALRPETPADEPFMKALFAANNALVLHQAALPAEMLGPLLEFQHRSQTQTYRAMFPGAVWSVVLRAGEPIGRLIENDEGDVVYFVDFALTPQWQGQGVGSALLGALIDSWAACGRAARAKVLMTNEPSLKMFARLGFVVGGEPVQGHVALRRAR